MKSLGVAALVALLVGLPTARAWAYDPETTFRQGTYVLSVEAGGGHQSNLENHRVQSEFDLWYLGVRASILPFRPVGKGNFLYGAFEAGLEPIYQRYESPTKAYWAGLSAVGRYHFLSLGRFVPYAELGAGAGGTNLRSIEIDSSFAFLLFGGVGAQVFVTDATALYGGYRMVHISNGNTSRPNRGFEANTGVAGVSFYFK